MNDNTKAIGDKLRAARVRRGLSLAAVQEKSGGRWKGVVVGSYERGDRNITAAKLLELASFYDLPVSELLPGEEWTTAAGPDGSTPDAVIAQALLADFTKRHQSTDWVIRDGIRRSARIAVHALHNSGFALVRRPDSAGGGR